MTARTAESPALAIRALGGACTNPHRPLAKERGSNGHSNRHPSRRRAQDAARHVPEWRAEVGSRCSRRGGQEVNATALLHAAATALVPEPFLHTLRYEIPCTVTISGIPVDVTPSPTRPASTPDVEVAAWERVRDAWAIANTLVLAETPGPVEYPAALPKGIARLEWSYAGCDITVVPAVRHLTAVRS